MQLANKNALITGGSNGIGQAIALAFAYEGANVIFTYNQNKDEAHNTLNQMGTNCTLKKAIQANLSDEKSIPHLLNEVGTHFDKIDILVNNAGIISRFANFLDISADALDELIKVNFRAPFVLTQQVARCMKVNATKGSIINISSVSATITSPGLAHYEASKAALNALTRGAANDLASYNIRVNTIAPGLVTTNMNKMQREQHTDQWDLRKSKIPLGRVGKPSDIANLAVFLASDASEWMTGAIIPLDGGFSVASLFKS
ncbi:MAG: glucose 1-dehydrogenase [Tatlockia sp.]|nr:glucose 1-dehydrogenase [Tatlockia sp.]